MYTAACSVKGWPQKRAGAVETFLKTFVSASRWISLALCRSEEASFPPISCLFSCSSRCCLVLSCLD